MQQYYDNIDNCPLFVFRDVMIKHDYKRLFKANNSIVNVYDEQKAKEVWVNLYDKYNEAVKSKSVNISFELRKQAEVLNNEYSMLTNCLFAIAEGAKINIINDETTVDVDQFIKIINNYNYRFQKSKGIANEIKRVKKQLRNYKSRIDQLLVKIKSSDENTSDWTFDNTIDSVERFRGIAFDEKVTVKKFTIVLNALIKQGENKPKDGK